MEEKEDSNQLHHKHILEKQQCISQVHFNNNTKFEIASHLEQMHPTKCRRLNYYKMKQFIHTRS